jgi:hypothetical protein
MHPEVRQVGPGSCPICGMALEPMLPTTDAGPNPELIDMQRRFTVSIALLVVGADGIDVSREVNFCSRKIIALRFNCSAEPVKLPRHGRNHEVLYFKLNLRVCRVYHPSCFCSFHFYLF